MFFRASLDSKAWWEKARGSRWHGVTLFRLFFIFFERAATLKSVSPRGRATTRWGKLKKKKKIKKKTTDPEGLLGHLKKKTTTCALEWLYVSSSCFNVTAHFFEENPAGFPLIRRSDDRNQSTVLIIFLICIQRGSSLQRLKELKETCFLSHLLSAHRIISHVLFS